MADLYAKAAGGNWSAAGTWSAVSSAGVDSAGPPTNADRAIFETGSGAVTVDSAPVCRSLDCTAGTGNYGGTLTHSAGITLTIGDATAATGNIALKFSSGMTYTRSNASTSATSFVSTSATQQTITTAGKTLGNVTLNGAGSSYQQLDDFIYGSGATFTNTAGAWASNTFKLDGGSYVSTGAGTRSLDLSTSTSHTFRSTGTAWNVVSTLSLTASTSTINLVAAGNITFTGGGLTYNNVSFAPTAASTVSMGGANTINGLTFTGSANTGSILSYSANQTHTNLTVTGNSSTNTIDIKSSSAGTARTITLSNAPTLTNVGTITDITIPASVKVDVPSTVTNGGNNTGIAFLRRPSMIQSAGTSVGTPAASATATFTNTTRNITTTTQAIVVMIQARTASTTPAVTSVTDSAGNTYFAIASTGTAFSTAQGWQEYWWCPTASGGITTVTANVSINSNFGMTIVELTDSNTVDQLSQSTGNSTTAATGPTGTTTLANELILGVTGVHAGGAVATSAGFQMLTTQSAASPLLLMRAGVRTATATGTFSWSTAISTGIWAATLVTFMYIPNNGSTLTQLGAG